MSLPSLSVVVPNYNHSQFLPAALGAILEQSVPASEVIVIDDASTDNSLEILNGFARKHPNLKVHRNEKNQGVLFGMRRGIELANSEYVLFAAADDQVLPRFFEKSLRLLARHPEAGLSCTVSTWRYEDSGLEFHMSAGMAEQPAYLPPEELVQLGQKGKLMISSSSVLFRKSALESVGGFRPELRWHTDWFACFTSAFRFGLCYVPEPLSLVNIVPKSFYTGRKLDEHREVLQRILELLCSSGFADVKPRVRDSGALSLFEFEILRIMRAHPEFRYFLTPTFVRRALRRRIELMGRNHLPKWVARLVLNTFYRHKR
jgi:glycosyltransferase involved in cell wall biosynthesis